MPPSPTGTNPKLVWTSKWLATWLQAKAAYDGNVTSDPGYPWYRALRQLAANNSGTDNFGLAATILYQITGDSAWALKAWNWLLPSVIPPASGIGYNPCDSLPPSADANSVHVRGLIYILMYDWLKPFLLGLGVQSNGLSAQQNFINWINWLCALNLNTINAAPGDTSGPWCLGQHKNTYSSFGFYIGNINGYVLGPLSVLYFTALATAPENPLAGSYLSASAGIPLGGLDPSGYDPSNPLTWAATLRNAYEHALQVSVNGPWIEGNQYEAASFQGQCVMAAGVKTALALTGDTTDHFPSLTNLLPNYGAYLINNLTPGADDLFQWGDTENAHNLTYADRMCNAMLVMGMTTGNIAASYLQSLIQQWASGPAGYFPKVRAFLLYDPYYPAHDWRNSLSRQTKGLGETIVRSGVNGWTKASDSVLYADTTPHTFCNHTEVDEEIESFALYRKGEWVFDVDRTYGGTGIDWNGRNSVGLYGLGTAYSHRQLDAEEEGTDYVYRRSSTYGNIYPDVNNGFGNLYFNPPPEYLHELTISSLYVRSLDQSSDIRIAFIRTNAEDPTTLTWHPHYSHYQPFDWKRIGFASQQAGPYAPKQVSIKIPTATPAVNGGNFSWTTDGGKPAIVSVVAPSLFSYNIVPTAGTFCPAQTTVVAGASSNIQNVADTSKMAAGYTLSFQQSQTSGIVQSIIDATHVQLRTSVSTITGEKVVITSDYNYGSGYVARLLTYYLRVQLDKPGGTNPASPFDTFCIVWMTGDPGVLLTTTAVASTDGRMAGVRVHRGSQHEVLALGSQVSSVVNASTQPTANDVSRRIISSGFNVNWTAGNDCTEVFLTDLDPAKTWTASVDGRSPIALNVSLQAGMVRFMVSGQRAHTLAVTAS